MIDILEFLNFQIDSIQYKLANGGEIFNENRSELKEDVRWQLIKTIGLKKLEEQFDKKHRVHPFSILIYLVGNDVIHLHEINEEMYYAVVEFSKMIEAKYFLKKLPKHILYIEIKDMLDSVGIKTKIVSDTFVRVDDSGNLVTNIDNQKLNLGNNYNIVYEKPDSNIGYTITINAKTQEEAEKNFYKNYPTFKIKSITKAFAKGGSLNTHWWKDAHIEVVDKATDYWSNLKMLWNKNELKLSKKQIAQLREVQKIVNEMFPQYNYKFHSKLD